MCVCVCVCAADLAHDVGDHITWLHMLIPAHHAEGHLYVREVLLVWVVSRQLGE